MAWHRHPLDLLLGILRFLTRVTWIFNLILLGFFSVYLTARTLHHLFFWMERVVYSRPW